MRTARSVIHYAIGSSAQVLVLSKPVLDHFWRHRQRGFLAREAGGQLFGRRERNIIEIIEATGPRTRDRRTPWSYEPCREEEQAEIDERYSAGLQFLGDWHTHAQQRPRPSDQDRWNVADIVRRSRHSMNGLLMVIVGTTRTSAGLCVCVSDGVDLYELSPDAT